MQRRDRDRRTVGVESGSAFGGDRNADVDHARFADVERIRFANDGTRAVLARILDDLLQRIDDRRIAAEDAAAIVGRLRTFCADRVAEPGQRSLRGLFDALDPGKVAPHANAHALAASYARLAARVAGAAPRS